MCVCVCLKEIAGDDREGEMVCVRVCGYGNNTARWREME